MINPLLHRQNIFLFTWEKENIFFNAKSQKYQYFCCKYNEEIYFEISLHGSPADCASLCFNDIFVWLLTGMMMALTIIIIVIIIITINRTQFYRFSVFNAMHLSGK